MLLWSIVVVESLGEEASSAANKELSFWTKDWMIDVSELVIRLDSIENQGSWCCILRARVATLHSPPTLLCRWRRPG